MNVVTVLSDILVNCISLSPLSVELSPLVTFKNASVSFVQNPVVSKNLLYGPVLTTSFKYCVDVDIDLYSNRSNVSSVANKFIAQTGLDCNILLIVLWKKDPFFSIFVSIVPKIFSRSEAVFINTGLLTGPFLENPITIVVNPCTTGVAIAELSYSSMKIPGLLYLPI